MKIWVFMLLAVSVLSAQESNSWGEEFIVTSSDYGHVGLADMCSLSDGGFIVCWASSERNGSHSSWDICAQRYDRNGTPIQGRFRVNSDTLGEQTTPSISALSDGGFVVCWESYYQSSGWSINAQRFDVEGMLVGGEFRVSNETHAKLRKPHVSSLSNGGFVVCWLSWEQSGIYARLYSSENDPIGNEFRVKSSKEFQESPSVCGLSDGGFVICWMAYSQDDYRGRICAQRYSTEGQPIGDEFMVDGAVEEKQEAPSIIGLSDGGFVVCWYSHNRSSSLDEIRAQRYDNGGNSIASAFRVNSTVERSKFYPDISSLFDGGFIVCWMSYRQTNPGYDIYAQRYNADGTREGVEFRVNSSEKEDQSHPSVAGLSGGGFAICWRPEINFMNRIIIGKRFPDKPLHHTLRSFDLISPNYDETVSSRCPTLIWRAASEMVVAYPWELEYIVCYDTLSNFATARFDSTVLDTTLTLESLNAGKVYYWKVLAKTFYGDSLWSATGAFFVSHTATHVSESPEKPEAFALLSNYPNPFNPTTTISFDLPKDGFVVLKIYDITGRLVRVLVQEQKLAGAHSVLWDGLDDAGQKVAAGVYLYQIEFEDAAGERMVMTRKMSLVK